MRPLMSIYNGRTRDLGGAEDNSPYIKVQARFRKHIKHFKGARLAVFMAIALHIDEEGWSYPSIPLLCEETGYNKGTVSAAITDLCEMEIEGERVLLAIQVKEGRHFAQNRYLIFPSKDDVRQHETEGAYARKPRRADTAEVEIQSTGFSDTEGQYTEKQSTEDAPLRRTMVKKNQIKEEGGGVNPAPAQNPTPPAQPSSSATAALLENETVKKHMAAFGESLLPEQLRQLADCTNQAIVDIVIDEYRRNPKWHRGKTDTFAAIYRKHLDAYEVEQRKQAQRRPRYVTPPDDDSEFLTPAQTAAMMRALVNGEGADVQGRAA